MPLQEIDPEESASTLLLFNSNRNNSNMARNRGENSQGRNSEDEIESDSSSEYPIVGIPVPPPIPTLSYVTVVLLFSINLLNYMDRFTIAGVLTEIQSYFEIDDAQGGLLQTVFVCSFMIFAPIFGFLGDRFSRKLIMLVGILVWSLAVLSSTFVKSGPKNFGTFAFLRGIVGIGEASYTTVAPTIIADLFTSDRRSKMLMLFYFAIPVGSGLGFVVGSNVAAAFGKWQWGVRVTPIFGLILCLLMGFVLKEPKRGEAEHAAALERQPWLTDLKQILRCRSYIWSTLGFTCVAFVAGSLTWWAPTYVYYGKQIDDAKLKSQISLIFGVITCMGGFIGVTAGATASQYWRRFNPRADPLICAIGLLSCTPFLFFSLLAVAPYLGAAWPLMFFGIVCLSLNWSINSDILMYIMIPTRRATAAAFQILISHLLGDASSPYLIGVISDAIRGNESSSQIHYYALQYAMFFPTFVCILGGLFFIICAWYIESDRRKAEMVTKGTIPEEAVISSNDQIATMRNENSTAILTENDELQNSHFEAIAAENRQNSNRRSRIVSPNRIS